MKNVNRFILFCFASFLFVHAAPPSSPMAPLEDKDKNGLPDGWAWCGKGPNGETTRASFAPVDGAPAFVLIDRDPKEGFGIARSGAPVRFGKSYRIRAEMKGGGLALYFFWYDAAGKKIGKETAKSVTAGPSFALIDYAERAPEGAATCTIWLYSCISCTTEVSIRGVAFEEGEAATPTTTLPTPSTPADIEAALGFESKAWSGIELTDKTVKEGRTAGLWKDHVKNPAIATVTLPRDLSGFNEIRFWMHSEEATGEGVMLILDSQRDKSVYSYYSYLINVKWKGWKEIKIPFQKLGAVRDPAGFQKIDRITLTTDGWGLKPHPQSVLHLDAMRFMKGAAPIMKSEAWKKPLPDPARVKEIAAWLDASPSPALYARVSDRAAWAVAAPLASNAILAAERQVAAGLTPFSEEAFLEYTRTGKRTADGVYYRRIRYLRDLILAECIENKGRFLPPLEAALKDFSGMKTWLLSACDGSLQNYRGEIVEIDLASAAHALLYAAALSGLGERLTPQTKASLQAELRRRIFDPYRGWVTNASRSGLSWWMTGINNWNAVCHAGVVLAALSSLPTAEERAFFVHGAELGMPYFWSGIPDDGYCTEGIGYWGYGFGNFVLLASAVKAATKGKLDWFDSAKTAAVGRFGARMELMPGRYPAYADCHPSARPSEWIMHYMARLYDPPALSAWSNAPSDATDPQTWFLTSSPVSPYFKAAAYPALRVAAGDRLRDFYPIAGILNCRPGDPAASNAIAVSLKGGHNAEEHNHNDLGSFVVSTRRAPFPLLVDPGSEVYTRDTFSAKRYESKAHNSYGHSVPVVDGTYQRTGREAQARILESNFSMAEDRFALDLTSAYEDEVPALKSLVRRFTYARAGGGALTVSDALRAEEPVSYGTGLITFGKWSRTSPDTLLIHDAGEALEVRVAASRPWTIRELRFTEDLNAKRKPLRLGIDLEGKATNAALTLTIRQVAAPGLAGGVFEGRVDASFPKAPLMAKALLIEAEALAAESGGKVNIVKDKVNASGAAFMNWDSEGHALTWAFEAPAAGDYAIQLRYCSDNDLVARAIQIDGVALAGASNTFSFARTGGWSSTANNWRDAWLADAKGGLRVPLTKGPHRLTMVNTGGSMNLDWIKVVPAGK
jgi:hypothetical protein